MKIKVTITKFLGLLLFLLAAAFFIGKAIFSKFQQFSQMSLIHESDLSKITNVVIKNKNDSIEIFNIADVWFARKNGQVFPCSHLKIVSFFSKLAQPRVYSLYSKDSSSLDRYSLDENSCFQLILKNGEKLHSKIDLGSKDFSHSFVFYTTASDPFIYKMFYDFENFITTDAAFWNDPSLFFENPFGRQTLSKIVATLDSKGITVQAGSLDKDGNDVFQKIKTLRHGTLFSQASDMTISGDFIRAGAKPELFVRAFYGSDSMDIAFLKISDDYYLISYSAMDGALSCSFTLSRWSYLQLRTVLLSVTS